MNANLYNLFVDLIPKPNVCIGEVRKILNANESLIEVYGAGELAVYGVARVDDLVYIENDKITKILTIKKQD